MAKKTAALLPATDDLLRRFGERLRLARLRRRLSAKQLAERAGMAPMTLRSLERGGSGVTVGAYLAVMQVLGVEKDLDLLGKADPVGRELQDARLPAHARTTRPSEPIRKAPEALPQTQRRKAPAAMPSAQRREAVDRVNAPQREIKKLHKPSEDTQDWIKKSGFASADALADLIEPLAWPKKKGR
jgi:transcriptional regulator with XRE-family HTH domain